MWFSPLLPGGGDLQGAASVSGTVIATEAGEDSLSASGVVAAGTPFRAPIAGIPALGMLGGASGAGVSGVAGDLAVGESGSDAFVADGLRAVTGSFAAAESGGDTLVASGFRAVTGSASVSELGGDAFAAVGSVTAGSVTISGDMSALESGSDSFASSGFRAVTGIAEASEIGPDSFVADSTRGLQGALDVAEAGADSFAAGGSVGFSVTGSLAASEVGADSFLADGATNATVSITIKQALLLRRLHQLHGLAEPLLVSATAREAGDLRQSVTDSGGVVTVHTIAGSDTFTGDVGTMIEELAALHGLTAPLVVTPVSRVAGSITQSLQAGGGQTLVVRQ